MSVNLLSNATRVETPFILATFGKYAFGLYNNPDAAPTGNNQSYLTNKIVYPNYMKSLTVNKVNGTVNTYTLVMVYPIVPGADPNLFEKVFSSVGLGGSIKLSYGDLSIPSYIYKEEEAIITDIKSNFNINSSTITYTVSCTSKALSMAAGSFTFQKCFAKPSDIIIKLLYDSKYGLLDIFYGMRDKEKVLLENLIASDDRAVSIEYKEHVTIFEYLNYLASCMSNINDSTKSIIKKGKYTFTVFDDTTGTWGGPYFKVSKVSNNITNTDSLTTYEIDIGAMSKDAIISFNIDDNLTYSILYEYSNKIKQANYVYRINDKGEIITEYSPTISSSSPQLKTTEADKTWWTRVTQYPVSATLVLKGLLRPAILMSYVQLNILFYGRKHINSGAYIITKQTDQIDETGYRTTLKLTRVEGASNDY